MTTKKEDPYYRNTKAATRERLATQASPVQAAEDAEEARYPARSPHCCHAAVRSRLAAVDSGLGIPGKLRVNW